jgi:hypothetical protein
MFAVRQDPIANQGNEPEQEEAADEVDTDVC